jgi:hypothetical protein
MTGKARGKLKAARLLWTANNFIASQTLVVCVRFNDALIAGHRHSGHAYYLGVAGRAQMLQRKADELAFALLPGCCGRQVNSTTIRLIILADGRTQMRVPQVLDEKTTRVIFGRANGVKAIEVELNIRANPTAPQYNFKCMIR